MRWSVVRALLAAMCLLLCGSGWGQAAGPAGKDDAVVMLSDLHFDPLHDPAKVARLAAAPVEEWGKILEEPDSPKRAAEFEAMQTECSARGTDPDNALIEATLKAARQRAPNAKFVTVTGDLLVHDFGCRYHAMTHGKAEPGTGTMLIEKAVNYAMRRVEETFPNVPVYLALGNNDSACGDYHLGLNDKFLAATAASVAHGWRGAGEAEVKRAEEDYRTGGFYSLPMGGGVEHGRVVVIDDIYNAAMYGNCPNTAAEDGAAAELKWLDAELSRAEAAGEKVWVLGHIPPGADAFNTLKHLRSVCTRPATMFLASDALADVLVKHAGVIKLALFAHTHEDEVRLLGREGAKGKVPVKLVPAVSMINGNMPSFTVAQVDPATAVMVDYRVYLRPENGTGFTEEYEFRTTYHQPDFTAKSVGAMVDLLEGDKSGEKPESQAYMKYFYPGEGSPLFLVWPQYGCTLTKDREADFKQCICGK